MFGKDWQPAQATIVQVHIKKTTGDGMVSIREFAADVRMPTGEVYRTGIQEPRWAMDFFPPSVGDVVRVQRDAKSGTVRFDVDDPQLSVKQHDRAKKAAFEAALNAPTPSPAAAAFTPTDLQELMKRANAGVVRLDAADPQAAQLREMILKAAGLPPEN